MKNAPWIVRRTVCLNANVAECWLTALRELPGMIGVEVKDRRCKMVYDVRQIQFAAIVAVSGNALAGGRLWQWRVRWWQFLDTNNRDGLMAKEGACCNRPPPRH